METSPFGNKFVPLIFTVLELLRVSTALVGTSMEEGRFCSKEGDCYISVTETRSGSGKTWSEAQEICKSLNATLPIVDDSSRQRSFATAIRNLTSNTFMHYWIGANASYDRGATWRWLNGSSYNETVTVDSQPASYSRSYAYMSVSSTTPTTEIALLASSPTENLSYICQFSSLGSNDCEKGTGQSAFQTENSCYVVYSEKLPWYRARNNCLIKGGDLATFRGASILNNIAAIVKNNISSGRYWIGLRSSSWNWTIAGTGWSNDVTFSYWAINQPDDNMPNCISTDRELIDDIPTWRDYDCTKNVVFICQDFSTTTRVNALSDSTVSSPTAFMSSITDNERITTIQPLTKTSQSGVSVIPLAVGIGVGVGVPLLITAIVVIAVFAIKKKRRRENNNTSRSMKAIVKKDEVVVSSAEENGSKPANQRPGEGDYAQVQPHVNAYDNANELQSTQTRPTGQGIIYSDLSFRQSYS